MSYCEEPCNQFCPLVDVDSIEQRAAVGPIVQTIERGEGGNGKYTRQLLEVAHDSLLAAGGASADSVLEQRVVLAARKIATYKTCAHVMETKE